MFLKNHLDPSKLSLFSNEIMFLKKLRKLFFLKNILLLKKNVNHSSNDCPPLNKEQCFRDTFCCRLFWIVLILPRLLYTISLANRAVSHSLFSEIISRHLINIHGENVESFFFPFKEQRPKRELMLADFVC